MTEVMNAFSVMSSLNERLKDRVNSFYGKNVFDSNLLFKIAGFIDDYSDDSLFNSYLIANRSMPLEEIVYEKVKNQIVSKLSREGYSTGKLSMPSLEELEKKHEGSFIGVNKDSLESFFYDNLTPYALAVIFDDKNSLMNSLNPDNNLFDASFLKEILDKSYSNASNHEKIDYYIRLNKLITPIINPSRIDDFSEWLRELSVLELTASEYADVNDIKQLGEHIDFYKALINHKEYFIEGLTVDNHSTDLLELVNESINALPVGCDSSFIRDAFKRADAVISVQKLLRDL